MPELPEVETVKRTLEKNYLSRTILYSEVLLPRMILSPLDEFINNTKNTKIISIERKGKFLIFNLSNNFSFISHLRMEGKYILRKESDSIISHTRVVFHLDNNEKLCYDDSRSFGIMKMAPTNEIYQLKELSSLGKEPFDIDDGLYLYNKLKNKNIEIKASLLDQTIMTGLGNIYADEVLFKSKINPYRKSSSITLEECNRILQNAKETLKFAIELGGSTISSYHPEKGVDGKFQNQLIAYGREGKKCVCCSSIMLKDKLQGRGTTYCPNCQNVCISIGITGKIASGKSTLLSYIKEKHYKVFSCDQEVKRLYLQANIKEKLKELLGNDAIDEDGNVSYGYIKNIISIDMIKKKKLEGLIHPLIKEKIKKFIKDNKEEQFVFIEVPLMFETRFNLLFDYIIGITCSKETQIRHLRSRNSFNIDQDLLLNSSTSFDKHAHKCNFLINNDTTKDQLFNDFDAILSNMHLK
ncbi:MAG: DNA-formamidopyrimidine glycosylase [Bacilli bacterium]